jgi:hypothetical protein
MPKAAAVIHSAACEQGASNGQLSPTGVTLDATHGR